MKLLDQYFQLQKEIHDYFGYVEDWVVIPIDDAREYYWALTNHCVGFSPNKDEVLSGLEGEYVEDSKYYQNEIYTQRFLPKWVYRGPDYTMICVDTHVDGNKFLQIFDNAKELKQNGSHE